MDSPRSSAGCPPPDCAEAMPATPPAALALVFQRSEQGILIATGCGGRWANPAAARLLGVDPRAARERPLEELLPELSAAGDRELRIDRGGSRLTVRAVRDQQDATTIIYLSDGGPAPGPAAVPHDETAFRAVAETLHDKEALFRQLAEHLPAVLWLSPADRSTVLYLSPAFESVFGWPADALRGGLAALLEIVHPDDRERVRAVIGHETEGSWEHEYRIVRPDGAIRWVRDRGFPVHDDRGRVYRYVGIAADITETRARDEALRGSEAEMRGLLGAMTDLIFVVDRDGRHLKVGPTSPDLLYRPAGFVHGRTLHEIFPQALADESLAAVRRALDEQRTVTIDYDLPIQGTQRWFSTALSPMDANRVVWVARDVTERVRAERERQEASDRLATLVDRSPLAIIGLDAEQRVSVWNRGAERIFGYAREEVMGQPLPYVPDDRREEFAAFHRALAEGREGVTNLETQRRRKDGSLVDVLLSTAAITGADGRPGAIAFVSDISERRRLEEELRQAQKMEAVGRLAGGVAHDFNNILTAIVNYSELLLQDVRPDDPRHLDLEEILKAGQRAARLTRQLLAFSRRQVLQPQLIDLGEIVDGMQPMLRRVIGEDIRLETTRAASDWPVHADPGQIEQVILNLAVNAQDAMPAGGTLRLEVEPRRLTPRDAEHHPGAAPGDYLVLAATDTGHGMPPETVERIFEPFFTTKEAGRGTGLGLSTVYGIVRQSGGFVTVQSTPEVGTTFSVFLPRWTGDAGAARDSSPEPVDATGGESILLVEDDDAVRTVARRVLQGHGYRVLEATNGREALELMEGAGASVDLVLTDYVMPEMGGRALVEQLTARGLAPAILYMSGYTDDALLMRGELPSGMRIVEKPFTAERLLSQVRQALRTHRPPPSS